jgi:hypothetical protein
MLPGFIVILAMLYPISWWARHEVGDFYDEYVARLGTFPNRAQLPDERRRDPFGAPRRLFSPSRMGIAQIYTPIPDTLVENRRRRAQLATSCLFAFLILAIPISQLVDTLAGGPPLASSWMWITVLRTIGLAIFGAWLIQWRVASADSAAPGWWRRTALLSTIGGLILSLFVIVFVR